MDDDDEEEDKGISAVRYPCMPSLVALQQMNNRLHLANLGRKLMKWTAQATRRELRRLAEEIDIAYQSFGENIRELYILLARARYFYPNLNKMVLGTIAHSATLTTRCSNKAVAGVKVIQIEVIDDGVDPYPLLGIDKGGQTIDEAKRRWKEFIKRLMAILQLRTGFEQVDTAHRTATKRGMVLRRIVMPRVKATINYIKVGLEEIAREDTFRLKMIQRITRRNRQKLEVTDEIVCPVCQAFQEVFEEESSGSPVCVKSPTPLPSIKSPTPAPTPEPSIKSVIKSPVKPLIPPNLVCPQHAVSCAELKIQELKTRLTEVIVLSKLFLDKGVESVNMVDFLKSCEDIKDRIECIIKDKEAKVCKTMPGSKPPSKVESKPPSKPPSKPVSELKSSMSSASCKVKTPRSITIDAMDPSVHKLLDLRNQIDDVVRITEKYREEGILSSSTESFLTVCNNVKGKIEKYTSKEEDSEKIDILKQQVVNLEELVADAKQEGFKSRVIDDFESSCKDFIQKLEQSGSQSTKAIQQLASNIADTIELSKLAQNTGLISEDMEGFLESSEKVKTALESKGMQLQRRDSDIVLHRKRLMISESEINMDVALEKITEMIMGGVMTPSTEDLIDRLEKFKQKKDGEMIYPPCSLTCSCSYLGSSEICTGCSDPNQPVEESTPPSPTPSCCDHIIFDDLGIKSELKRYNKNANKNDEKLNDFCDRWNNKTPGRGTDSKTGSSSGSNSQSRSPHSTPSTSAKIRKIVKTTRIEKSDGTVKEEVETITITDDSSYDNCEIRTCILPEPNLNVFKFPRYSKSDYCFRSVIDAEMFAPILRSCISFTDFRGLDRNSVEI